MVENNQLEMQKTPRLVRHNYLMQHISRMNFIIDELNLYRAGPGGGGGLGGLPGPPKAWVPTLTLLVIIIV
jgi:hypothetical protein